jgi:hypothetical protein
MKFEMWSLIHILYILSPFVLFALIFLCIKKCSDKVKYIVGIVIGAMSIFIIIPKEEEYPPGEEKMLKLGQMSLNQI